MLFAKKIFNKAIVQLLIILSVCAISDDLIAGRNTVLKWVVPENSFLNHARRMSCDEIQAFKKLAEQCGVEFKLIYDPGEKRPLWFESPVMFELLKAMDYAVMHWFSFNDEKIDPSGFWKLRMPRNAVEDMEGHFGSTYDNNLVEMLSAVICHVFSKKKLSVKSRDYIILRLLWVNEQILPDRMAFNWVEKYKGFKQRSVDWEVAAWEQLELIASKKDSDAVIEVLKANNRVFMEGYDNRKVKVKLVGLYKTPKPDIKYDMLMVWDALKHKYRIKDPAREQYTREAFSQIDADPLFDFYFEGLLKLELFDDALDVWKKALAVAWRQRFIIERRQDKKDIPDTEWDWFSSVDKFDFPPVPDIAEIPSLALLSINQEQGGEDMETGEQSSPSPDANEVASQEGDVISRTFEEELKELKVRLGYMECSKAKRESKLDYNPILNSDAIKKWYDVAVEKGLSLADIIWPCEVCPVWYDSPILYRLLDYFSACVECWVVEHQHDINAFGHGGKASSCLEGERESFEASLDKVVAEECDNNLLDMLAVLLPCAYSDKYSEKAKCASKSEVKCSLEDEKSRPYRYEVETLEFSAKSRDYTNLRLLWICRSLFPRGATLNWNARFELLKKESEKWEKNIEPADLASVCDKDVINSTLAEKYPDHAREFSYYLLWEEDGSDHEVDSEQVNIRLVQEHIYNLCCSGQGKRRTFGMDPFLNVYTNALLKMSLFDPIAFDDEHKYMRAFIIALYQRALIRNKKVLHQQNLVDGWNWYSTVKAYKFPNIGLKSKATIPFEVEGLGDEFPALVAACGPLCKVGSPAVSSGEPEVLVEASPTNSSGSLREENVGTLPLLLTASCDKPFSPPAQTSGTGSGLSGGGFILADGLAKDSNDTVSPVPGEAEPTNSADVQNMAARSPTGRKRPRNSLNEDPVDNSDNPDDEEEKAGGHPSPAKIPCQSNPFDDEETGSGELAIFPASSNSSGLQELPTAVSMVTSVRTVSDEIVTTASPTFISSSSCMLASSSATSGVGGASTPVSTLYVPQTVNQPTMSPSCSVSSNTMFPVTMGGTVNSLVTMQQQPAGISPQAAQLNTSPPHHQRLSPVSLAQGVSDKPLPFNPPCMHAGGSQPAMTPSTPIPIHTPATYPAATNLSFGVSPSMPLQPLHQTSMVNTPPPARNMPGGFSPPRWLGNERAVGLMMYGRQASRPIDRQSMNHQQPAGGLSVDIQLQGRMRIGGGRAQVQHASPMFRTVDMQYQHRAGCDYFFGETCNQVMPPPVALTHHFQCQSNWGNACNCGLAQQLSSQQVSMTHHYEDCGFFGSGYCTCGSISTASYSSPLAGSSPIMYAPVPATNQNMGGGNQRGHSFPAQPPGYPPSASGMRW